MRSQCRASQGDVPTARRTFGIAEAKCPTHFQGLLARLEDEHADVHEDEGQLAQRHQRAVGGPAAQNCDES